MKKSTNKKVQEFINKIMLVDQTQYQIVQDLRRIVMEAYPNVEEKMMYGGIIFSQVDDFSGIFAYKNHVSLEFSRGFEFEDPHKFLEGKGKYRRHLKFRSPEEIKSKKADYFVAQSKLYKD